MSNPAATSQDPSRVTSLHQFTQRRGKKKRKNQNKTLPCATVHRLLKNPFPFSLAGRTPTLFRGQERDSFISEKWTQAWSEGRRHVPLLTRGTEVKKTGVVFRGRSLRHHLAPHPQEGDVWGCLPRMLPVSCLGTRSFENVTLEAGRRPRRPQWR